MKKRTVALLLCVAMLVALFPATSFAVTLNQELIFVNDPTYHPDGSIASLHIRYTYPTGEASSQKRNVVLNENIGHGNTLFETYKNSYATFEASLAGIGGVVTYDNTWTTVAAGDVVDITTSFTQGALPLTTDTKYYVYMWAEWNSHFYPDALLAILEVKGGKLYFTTDPEATTATTEICDHALTYTLSQDQTTITEACSKCDHSKTMRLIAANAAHSGAAYTGAVVSTEAGFVGTVGSIRYYQATAQGQTTGGTLLGAAPSAVGYYYAAVTAGDKTAVAPFTITANTYTIIYKDGGGTDFSGTHEDGAPMAHTENAATTLKRASKPSYRFDGWFDDPACTGTALTTLSPMGYTGDITLYAKWTAKNTLRDCYVNANGDDVNGTGAYDAPLKTLAEAYAVVQDGGTIHVQSDLPIAATLNMNTGKDITLQTADKNTSGGTVSGPVTLAYTSAGALTVSAGTVTFADVTLDGGAVWDGTVDPAVGRGTANTGVAGRSEPLLSVTASDGGVILAAGCVLQNSAASTGGVAGVYAKLGSLTINGGKIINCYADGQRSMYNAPASTTSGAAVLIDSAAFTFSGGELSGNDGAAKAALTLCHNKGKTSAMSGGVVTKNRSTGSYAGGVLLDAVDSQPAALAAWLDLTGGTVTNNTSAGGGGGIAVLTADCELRVGNGSAITVVDNKAGAADSNVYVKGAIAINGGIAAGSSIGINTSPAPSTIADGKFATGAAAADAQYFFADDPATAGVLYDDGTNNYFGNAIVMDAPHTHAANTLWLSLKTDGKIPVADNFTNASLSASGADIGLPFAVVVTPDDGYVMPGTFTLAVNGTEYTVSTATETVSPSGGNITYAKGTRTLTIPAALLTRTSTLSVRGAADPATYVLTLDKNGGTSDGTLTATYDSATLTALTHAARADHLLTGYFSAASGGNKVIRSDGTLERNVSGYTDADGKWTRTSSVTLYAQWTPIPAYGVALDPETDKTFPPATVGYGPQTPHSITVRNSGNQPTGGLVISLSGPDAASFTLSATSIAGLGADDTVAFTVAPNTGLVAGTYTAIVKVEAAVGNRDPIPAREVSLHFTVNTAPVQPSPGGGDTPLVPAAATVYNDPNIPKATIWLSGSGLAANDLLITQRDPVGSQYAAMRLLAGAGDVLGAYNIHLRSGRKSTGSAMYLTFDLNVDLARQAFTLVQQKANGDYEYFYATADANKADVTFGPLYELSSPFLLVKGTLLQGAVPSAVAIPETGHAAVSPAFILLTAASAAVLWILYRRKTRAAR